MRLARAQRGSVFALFVAVRARTGHQLGEGAGGSRRRVCLYSSFTGGLIVRCDQLPARRPLWRPGSALLFHSWQKTSGEGRGEIGKALFFLESIFHHDP